MLRSVLLLAGFVASASADACNIDAFDKAAGDILIYGNAPSIAVDKAGLQAKCSSERRSLRIVQEYTDRCVRVMGRGLLQVFIDGAANEIDKHCYDGPARDKFLRLIPCMNQKAGRGIYQCNRDLAGVIQGTMSVPSRSRIPLSCCILNEYVSCVSKHAAKCGSQTRDFAREMIHSYAGDLLETVCLKYRPSSKECRSLPKVIPTSPAKYTSFLAPLSEILDRRG